LIILHIFYFNETIIQEQLQQQTEEQEIERFERQQLQEEQQLIFRQQQLQKQQQSMEIRQINAFK